MKKNVGISDRIIRFVILDLFIGASFMGFEIPMWLATVSFLISLSLIFTVITGYSVIYQLFGISTRDTNAGKKDNLNQEN